MKLQRYQKAFLQHLEAMKDKSAAIFQGARRFGRTWAAKQSGATLLGIDPGSPEGDRTVLYRYDEQGRIVIVGTPGKAQ